MNRRKGKIKKPNKFHFIKEFFSGRKIDNNCYVSGVEPEDLVNEHDYSYPIHSQEKKKKKKKKWHEKQHSLHSSPSHSSRSESDGKSWESSDESSSHHRKYRRKRKLKRSKRNKNRCYSSSDSKEDEFEILTREELFGLTARELRRRCNRLGLDSSKATEKAELVTMLHNYYRLSANGMILEGGKTAIQQNIGVGVHSPFGTAIRCNGRRGSLSTHDESEQMLELLQEIIPFFGQNDPSIDTIVKETIERLPKRCLETPDHLGNTILMLACQSGAYDLIPLLLAKGSDPNSQNNDGATCLHFVCYSESFSTETAQVLIKHGAKAEVAEEKFGCTPLHWAAFIGDTNMCRILINAGALPTTRDSNGCDSISYAKQSNKAECVNFLHSCSAPATDMTSSDLEEESEWERLTDHQSGYIYYHNWNSGQSMWEDDFNEYKRKKLSKQQDKKTTEYSINKDIFPITKRPPPPSPGTKASLLSSTDTTIAYAISNSSNIQRDLDHIEEIVLEESDDKPNHILKYSQKELCTKSDNTAANTNGAELNETKEVLLQKSIPLDANNIDNNKKRSTRKTSNMRNFEEILSDSSSSTNNGKTSKNTCQETLATIAKPHGKGKGANKHDTKRQQLKVEIPSNPLLLSPMSTTSEKVKGVSVDTFEQRLSTLQSKMEDQFVEQLKKIEEKINYQGVPAVNFHPSDQRNESITEMSSKVVQLQSEIGSKDLEIISLKREIVALEGKLAAGSPNLRSPVQYKDAMIGDNDIKDEMWVSAEDTKQLRTELEAKNKKLNELQETYCDAQAKLGAMDRQFLSLKQKSQRTDDQLSDTIESLAKEKSAKDEILCLLEQTRRGIEVDVQVKQSMEEEKERGEKVITSLRESLKNLEKKTAEETSFLSEKIEEGQKKILTESSKVATLKDEIEQLKNIHIYEIQKLTKVHITEKDSIQENLIKAHQTEKNTLEDQLKEERLGKLEKEAERNEAVQAMDAAYKRADISDSKLKEMSNLIAEAKILIGVNEKLHRCLHVETDRRKALHNKLEDLKGRIRVYVRIRPLSSDEISKKCKVSLAKEDKRTCVITRSNSSRGDETRSWEFDQIFSGTPDGNNTQEEIFKDTRLLVTSAVDGFNVCIFAYGQTGSGKTFTMFGPGGEISCVDDTKLRDDEVGLAPRAAVELFRVLGERDASHHTSVNVNMFELYNDGLRDLLSTKKIESREQLRIKLAEHSDSGMVEVEGASTETVQNSSELLKLFKKGSEFRTTAKTQMNADSSRSHLVTSMVTLLENKRTGRTTRGKLTLVDLAGSERVSKSGATGHQLKEAQSINKSLSALGDVINALTSGNKHVPYRNHPLTMLMSDSIGGNAKTLMFVCCSPADYNCSESANSLDFAKRCKDVTNNVNDLANQSGQVKALRAELARMKKEKGGSFKRRTGVARRPGMHG